MKTKNTTVMLISLIILVLVNGCSTEIIQQTNGVTRPDASKQIHFTESATISTNDIPTPTNIEVSTETDTPEPTMTETMIPKHTPTFGIGSTFINDIDGSILIFVPDGEFLMGSESEDAWERDGPERLVYLDNYWIYQTPITTKQFSAFVNQTGYVTSAEQQGESFVWISEPDQAWGFTEGAYWALPEGPGSNLSGLDAHPVGHMSWYDAVVYCEWAGGRLPTEAEWEKAARGSDGRNFPWGDTPVTGEKGNFCDINCPRQETKDSIVDDGYAMTSPVGSYPDGSSPYGALDMAGNVWEWTSDVYEGDVYDGTPYEGRSNPYGNDLRVLRGGSWHGPAYNAWFRHLIPTYIANPNETGNTLHLIHSNVGFRCILDDMP